jgi:hypothetical protein
MLSFGQTSDFLIAKTTGKYYLYDSTEIRTFAFTRKLVDPSLIPSPTLYGVEGDSMEIILWNVSQGAPHTIHPHGLDVDQQNDGVPHLSFAVEHMDTGIYKFVAPHAGTYLYHCHVVSSLHVQAGMYGLVIIRPPSGSTDSTWSGGYQYDHEKAWLLSEVDTLWHVDTILDHHHEPGNHSAKVFIPNYAPSYFLINGKGKSQLYDSSIAVYGAPNEVTYVRLANVGYYANQVIFPSSLNARVVASDGRPLLIEESTDTVMVFPGERYGVLLEPSVTIDDSIQIIYRNLNNLLWNGVQHVPVRVGLTGIQGVDRTPGFKLIPNPASREVRITSKENAPIKQVELIDAIGRIMSVQLQDRNLLDIKRLHPGVYFVRIKHNSGYETLPLLVHN